ncbi:MAG: hypothetical protein H7A46_21505 [Verrucomicrobiales bacterium]|nr:hypothetical protein [Verrucomicrobiales bacterium]MCP5524123.1 hypothetical protein [Verrucomicrobiales bacterium]
MHSTALLFVAVFASTAFVEFCVLQRWFSRRSLVVCIGGVSAVSGVIWLAVGIALSLISFGWKSGSEPAMTAVDVLAVGFLLVLDALLLSLVAAVPAGLVAVIYRRFKRQS